MVYNKKKLKSDTDVSVVPHFYSFPGALFISNPAMS